MNPFRRADHADTERLLDSAQPSGDTRSGAAPVPADSDVTSPEAPASTPVARLLAAAAGPVRPGELAGEEAALAAFRAARAEQSPSAAHRVRRRRLTTGAAAWIGAVAVTATAGAAFAAVRQDWIPVPVAPEPSRTSPTPDSPRSGEPTRSPAQTPSRGTASPQPPSPGTPSVAAPPAHSPTTGSLHGKCRAWSAKKPDQREKALRTPAFERLVTAAGGADRVEEYCRRLGAEAKPSAPAKSAAPHPPSGRPSPK
ncbi:hypothetical protein [Micromonospora sp. WMMD1155]|uniref:hypothetical protein n=1 Tax=Micromonospora sp. WMMD1155 TaxID=3016094 RepID=UPI00249AE0E0|nr:hypothetical protein [Micromonospora sp. WMMD1155]WFE54068.1 hypothetical protein O7617_28660 [Micromonospora sp. WMMD1155]